MTPEYARQQSAPTVPGQSVTEAVLSDTTDMDDAARHLWILAAGNIKVRFLNGYERTFAVAAGDLFPPVPCWITRIWSTGTTVAAANILVIK